MKTIIEDIKQGTIKTIYLLYGEESYLIRQYRKRLCEAMLSPDDEMNRISFEGKDTDPQQVMGEAEAMPFFANRRVILVDKSGFFKKSPEGFAEYVERIPETTCLIFTEAEVDRRSKLFKQVSKLGHAAEFPRQQERVLTQWILGRLKKENKQITRSVLELFLGRTGRDMELIDRELEKLLSYTMHRDTIEEADLEAISAAPLEGKVFDMVDAIAARDQQRALERYYDLLILKEPPIRILILVTRHFQRLLHLRDMAEKGFDYRYMAAHLDMQEYVVRKSLGQARKFTIRQLYEALEDGVRTDEEIKTGQIRDQLAVELYLVKCSGANNAGRGSAERT